MPMASEASIPEAGQRHLTLYAKQLTPPRTDAVKVDTCQQLTNHLGILSLTCNVTLTCPCTPELPYFTLPRPQPEVERRREPAATTAKRKLQRSRTRSLAPTTSPEDVHTVYFSGRRRDHRKCGHARTHPPALAMTATVDVRARQPSTVRNNKKQMR